MPYLMRSQTLRALESPAFDKFLGPMSARVERRLKKHAVHKLVQSTTNIKYYIDLSPVLNDEEAMVQLTQLTVPGGALFWHQKAQEFSVSTDLVCGRDDLDIPPRPTYSYRSSDQDVHETDIENLEKKLDSIAHELKANETNMTEASEKQAAAKPKVNLYSLPLEEEYTQLRHHTAIARLLHAIAGHDPKLNSAAKAWTFCMLANYFECASNSRVSHWVISWILQTGNFNFIQSNPDIAYRMAVATRSVWLVRCTFAMLVGQQAMVKGLKNLASTTGTKSGHVATCLDDDEINRVDHAAEIFSRRMRNTFDEVAAFPGLWTFSAHDCAHLSKLNNIKIDNSEIQQCHDRVMGDLKNYLRRVIYMTLSDAYPFDNKSIPAFKESAMLSSYQQIPRPLRSLTQFHWDVLKHEELHRDYLDNTNNHIIWDNTTNMLKKDGLIDGEEIPYVSKQHLYDSIKFLNLYISFRGAGPSHARKPSSGEKRTSSDIENVSASQSPKKVKTVAKEENNHEVPRSLAYRLPKADRSSEPEVAIDPITSKTKGTTMHDDESDEEWEEVEAFRPERNAARFVSGLSTSRSRDVNDEALASGKDRRDPDLYVSEVPPGSSSSIEEKFEDMEIASAIPDDQKSLYNELMAKTGAKPAPVTPTQSDPRPRAPMTSDQQVTDHVLSAMKLNATQETTEQLKYSPGMIFGSTQDRNRPLETASEQFDQFPSSWGPKPPTNSPAATEAVWHDPREISPEGLLRDLSRVLAKRLSPLLTPGYIADGSLDFDIPVGNINTLLCLNEEEYKYLPLWAGGFDDGSGGVFDDGAEVPDAPDVADGGFRGGAMGIIPGVGSSRGGSMAGSEFEDLGTEIGISTVGKASRYATDGTATETVMSLDE